MCEICVFTCCKTHLALGKRLHPYHCEIPNVGTEPSRATGSTGWKIIRIPATRQNHSGELLTIWAAASFPCRFMISGILSSISWGLSLWNIGIPSLTNQHFMKGRGFEHSCGKIWICPWDSTQFFHGDTQRIHRPWRLLALLALAAEQTRDRRHGTKKQTHCGAQGWKKDETNPRFLLVLLLDEVCYLSCVSKSASENEFEDHVFTSCVYIYTYIIIYSYSNFGT